jgi:hypothetical protein
VFAVKARAFVYFLLVCICFAWFVGFAFAQALPDSEPQNNTCSGADRIPEIPFLHIAPYPALSPREDNDFYVFDIKEPGSWIQMEIVPGPTYPEPEEDIALTLYGECRNGIAFNETAYGAVDPDYYLGPQFAYIDRFLRPATYFLNLSRSYPPSSINDYALLLEGERDPLVIADAGSNACRRPSKGSTEVRLDGSASHRFAYREDPASEQFLDITGTGEEIIKPIDVYWKVLVFPEDYSFRFFGSERKRAVVTADGYLAFGIDWHEWFWPPFPSPDVPNDVIAPFWGEHFQKSQHGNIFYEYRDVDGDGDNDLVVEWYELFLTNIPWPPPSWYTFEAILHNGEDNIEFRYRTIPSTSYPWVIQPAIGLENCTGRSAVKHEGGVTDGDSLVYSWVPVPLPETDLALYNLEEKNAAVIDVSGSGTAFSLQDDDSAQIPFPPDFGFSFYGVPRDTVLVSSNGYLTFGGEGKSPNPVSIPDISEPNALIAPLWLNLTPGSSGGVFYEFQDFDGDSNLDLAVLWKDMQRKGTGEKYTLEAILHGVTGEIEFRYGTDVPQSVMDIAAIGIENDKGSDGVSCDPPIVQGVCRAFEPYTISNYQWYENGSLIATGMNPLVYLDKGYHTIELRAVGSGDMSVPVGKDTVKIYIGNSDKKCRDFLSDEDTDEDRDQDEDGDR